MDNEHNSPNPLIVMWCLFATIAITAGSFFLYSIYGQPIVPRVGRWIMVAPPVFFLLCLSFYWQKNREQPVWKWYASAMTVGFAIGYFLSYGLVFLFSLED